MKFTKCILICIICLISADLMSQTYGVKGGFTLSKMNFKDNDGTYNEGVAYIPGLMLGVIANYEIDNIFSIETGLNFTNKGMQSEIKDNGRTVNTKMRLLYFDIPAALKLRARLGRNRAFFIKAGPYVGIGIAGKYHHPDKEIVKWGPDEDSDDLRRLDYGILFGGGLELGRVLLSVIYNNGLANMDPNSSNGTKVSNRSLELTFGFPF